MFSCISISGFRDHLDSTKARFRDPEGCTPFGNSIVIADYNNDAIRRFDVDQQSVETLVKRGASGSPDGEYTGSANSGGGVSLPIFVESLNDTHLIVVQLTAEVRMIDTVDKIITTLGDLGSNVSLQQ